MCFLGISVFKKLLSSFIVWLRSAALALSSASSDLTVQNDDLTTYISIGANQLIYYKFDEWCRKQGTQSDQDCYDVIPAGVCTDG